MNKKIILGIICMIVLALTMLFLTQRYNFAQISDSELQKNISNPINANVVMEKSSYTSNENIKIKITNNYNESIFIPGAFAIGQIYKKNGDNWIILDSHCKAPYCIYELPGPEELRSGESKDIEWSAKYFIKRNSKPLEKGEYIISVEFRFDLKSSMGSNWIDIYSQKFIIE